MIALYKTFSGGEFIECSIRSIYEYVERIVCVNSNVSWGGIGTNNCLYILEDLQKKLSKIEIVNYDTKDQMDQVNYGLDYINHNYNTNWIMLIDTDEIWDREELEKAIQILSTNKVVNGFKTRVFTYIKSCFFRVVPMECLEPVCFVRSKLKEYGSLIRCCDMSNLSSMDVYYHHYSYVRKNFIEILTKLINSHISEEQETISIDEWIAEKWYKIPFVRNLHIAKGYEGNWKGIEVLTWDQLPHILRLKRPEILQISKEY